MSLTTLEARWAMGSDFLKTLHIFVAGIFSLTVAAFQPVLADEPAPQIAPLVNEEFGVPVFPYDITDRPYEVVGEVRAGVRKATIFSKAPSQTKIYRELWERAKKLNADAVVKAQYGDPHVTALSWGSTSATGVAVRFIKQPVQTSTPPSN